MPYCERTKVIRANLMTQLPNEDVESLVMAAAGFTPLIGFLNKDAQALLN